MESVLPEPPVPRQIVRDERRSSRYLAAKGKKTKEIKKDNSVQRWFQDVQTSLDSWFDDEDVMDEPIGGDHDYNW